ncbi:MAG: D-tyrosyl-tRNA(Tyr) deacylase [Verrucomicrobia bacterium]|nr:D-tyrosyl-tRNA(Tyr) deacylase [Verrucomicrobiota bacterium]
MRAVIQRVSSASVSVDREVIGQIGAGLLVLLAVHSDDTEGDARWLADKVVALRIFEDAEGRMNRSVADETTTDAALSSAPPGATILVVSQFTLLASTRKGNRPSFNDAAKPDVAIPLYEFFVRHVAAALLRPVATGRFGAMMAVSLVNNGPVTLVIDSKLRE